MGKIEKPIGEENIVYSGKIIDVVQQEFQSKNKIKLFEKARRSPGVRLIIINNKKEILLSREYRTELEEFDYRLPGGKVFDSKEERKKADKSKILEYAEKTAIKECLEETGLIAKSVKFYNKSIAGSSVEWDLYYFIIDEFEISLTGQKLEDGEVITTDWYDINQVINFIKNGNIKEDRSLGIIFKFLLENDLINLKK